MQENQEQAEHEDDQVFRRHIAKAHKKIIQLCENNVNRDVNHMAAQCNTCAQCKTCKSMSEIRASSYNAYREQVTMEEMVKFTPGKNGEPGYFMSALPIKPFDHKSVKGNQMTANIQNKAMVTKLNKDPEALEGVREEMKKIMNLGLIKKLKDLPKDIQDEINSDFKHFYPYNSGLQKDLR